MICEGCGRNNSPGGEFCNGCGTQLAPAGAAVPVSGKPAGFWIRVAASFVDGFICCLLVYLVMDLALGRASSLEAMSDAAALVGVALAIAFLASACQATPGKMVFGLRVVSMNGERVGLGQVILREVVGKFAAALLLGAGFVMVACHPEKRGLHDLIATTRVIHAGDEP